jgi:hypothetical protein
MRRLGRTLAVYPRILIYPVLVFFGWVALHVFLARPILLLVLALIVLPTMVGVVVGRALVGVWRLLVYGGRRQRDLARQGKGR